LTPRIAANLLGWPDQQQNALLQPFTNQTQSGTTKGPAKEKSDYHNKDF
jgi:hypothetical protein